MKADDTNVVVRVDEIVFFFFNDTATAEIYTLSLHDALPIFKQAIEGIRASGGTAIDEGLKLGISEVAKGKTSTEIGSTRLNSSHVKRSRMPSSA